MTPQSAPEPDWRAIGSGILQRLIGRLHAPREWLEDAVQDALVCMVVLMNGGGQIDNFVAFGVAFAKKRWVEERRKQQRRGELLKSDLGLDDRAARDKLGTPDWSAMLRQAGWEPTEAWSRILDAITSGVRGTNRIAEALGMHRKTVQEARMRLQRWLREKLDPPPAP